MEQGSSGVMEGQLVEGVEAERRAKAPSDYETTRLRIEGNR
jgi:hypothetical protein